MPPFYFRSFGFFLACSVVSCQLFGGKKRSLIFMANACQVTSDNFHGLVRPPIIVSATPKFLFARCLFTQFFISCFLLVISLTTSQKITLSKAKKIGNHIRALFKLVLPLSWGEIPWKPPTNIYFSFILHPTCSFHWRWNQIISHNWIATLMNIKTFGMSGNISRDSEKYQSW